MGDLSAWMSCGSQLGSLSRNLIHLMHAEISPAEAYHLAGRKIPACGNHRLLR